MSNTDGWNADLWPDGDSPYEQQAMPNPDDVTRLAEALANVWKGQAAIVFGGADSQRLTDEQLAAAILAALDGEIVPRGTLAQNAQLRAALDALDSLLNDALSVVPDYAPKTKATIRRLADEALANTAPSQNE